MYSLSRFLIIILISSLLAGIISVLSWAFLLKDQAADHPVSLYAALIVVMILSIAAGLFYLVKYTYDKPLEHAVRYLHRLSSEQVPMGVMPQFKWLPTLKREMELLTLKLGQDAQARSKVEKMRSEFLGNVSHELRTPIFALQGYIETLLDGAIDDQEVNRRFLERSFEQTRRLNTLLNDLIEISRIESGDMKFSLRYFSLAPFVATIIDEMQLRATQQGVTLAFHAPSESPIEFFGDKERIKQVLLNLVDNAIKYNKEKGSVTISLAQSKMHTEISIADTGIGIAQEHIERIFERFYRIDKDRSRDLGGTGLGLAIVKHIVQAHCGIVRVSSKPGAGTTFRLKFKRR